MKNLKTLKVMMVLGSLFITSCATPQSSSSNISSEESVPASVSSRYSYEEVSDAPLVISGDYIVNKLIYSIDKDNKKLTIIDYDMDFYKHDHHDGTIVKEYTINFVKYASYDAVHYKDETKDYFIYKDGTTFYYANIEGGTLIKQSINSFPLSPAEPYRPAIYISDKQTQTNSNEQGQEFYLFLRLRSTYASLYVGTRTEGWDSQLGFINDFKYSYNAKGMMIQIPHAEDEGKCTLTVVDNYTISFRNNGGSYECSGTFSFLAEDHE